MSELTGDTLGDDQLLEQIQTLFASAHASGAFNGNVLLAIDGRPVYVGVHGVADQRTARPLTADTVFNTASVSKTFVAMGVLMLVQRGVLDLDQPLGMQCPDLPYGMVTVRQLLSHTSGVPNYVGPIRRGMISDQWSMEKVATTHEMLTAMADLQPEPSFVPGTSCEYSNTGYLLLAKLLQYATGQSLSVFLHEAIFTPCGLTRTFASHDVNRADSITDYATGWMKNDHGVFQLPYEDPELAFCYYLDELEGDGNIHASMLDLLKWDQWLYQSSIFSTSTLEEAYTPMRTTTGEACPNGLGWFVRACGTYGKCVEHSGYWPGYGAEFRRYIDARKTLILLSNAEYEGSYRMRTELADQAEQLLLAWGK